MKNIIRSVIRKLGFDIVRYTKAEVIPSVTKKSDLLEFHQTATGNYYLPADAHGDLVVNAIINNKIFEIEIVDCASKYIKPNTIVLDIGSNFGQMSILFSNVVGSGGKVYAFEADNYVYKILRKNIEANNKTNIIPVFGAVHNIDGEVLYFPEQEFIRFQSYGAYGIDFKAKTGRPVKSITIDSLEIKDKISFMKIDIQGGDLFALEGAINTISAHKMPIIFEFEYLFQDDFNLKFQEYVDFVSSINYHFEKVIYGSNYLILPN